MVVHGPEAFDHGDVAWLLERVRPRQVIVAGVMARTAAEESGLEVVFDGRPPSRVIADCDDPVFLCNRGKTPHSGRVFGGIVACRLAGQGLVHVECSSSVVYTWNEGDELLALGLAGLTGFSMEDTISTDEQPDDHRLIRGCTPGEPVYVNGIVIGRATAGVVVLRSTGGQIEAVSGLDPKPHGMEKLLRTGIPEIRTAWCKSGAVRNKEAKKGTRSGRQGRILIIDHCGHEIYRRLSGDCCGVLAIGDDTAAVCGHICMHLGIPVLGITDNDRDAILPSAFAEGSLVLDTRPERDDDVGVEIAASVPEGPVTWDDWVAEVLDRFYGRLTVVLDLRETPS
jgi:hypothetical protein